MPEVEDGLGRFGLVFLLHPSTSSIPESLRKQAEIVSGAAEIGAGTEEGTDLQKWAVAEKSRTFSGGMWLDISLCL